MLIPELEYALLGGLNMKKFGIATLLFLLACSGDGSTGPSAPLGAGVYVLTAFNGGSPNQKVCNATYCYEVAADTVRLFSDGTATRSVTNRQTTIATGQYTDTPGQYPTARWAVQGNTIYLLLMSTDDLRGTVDSHGMVVQAGGPSVTYTFMRVGDLPAKTTTAPYGVYVLRAVDGATASPFTEPNMIQYGQGVYLDMLEFTADGKLNRYFLPLSPFSGTFLFHGTFTVNGNQMTMDPTGYSANPVGTFNGKTLTLKVGTVTLSFEQP